MISEWGATRQIMKLSTNTQKIIATDSLRVTERIFQEMLTAETMKTLDELYELIDHAKRAYDYIRARTSGTACPQKWNDDGAAAPPDDKETLQ